MTFRRLLLGFALSLVALGAFAATPPAPPPAAAPAILKQVSCFSGHFASYAEWTRWMREEKGMLSWAVVRWNFPEADFERYRRTLDCRFIRYRSDGHDVQGIVVVPKGAASAKLPVIVYNRGGNGAFGAMTFATLFDHVLPLAEQGFVVVASQYRGLEEPEGQPRIDQFGGDDVHDVVNLVKLLPAVPRADTGNVFMIGQSRGAIMALRALLDPAVEVRAVAIHSGALDMHELLRMRPEFEELFRERIPNYAANKRAELDARSATRWAEKLPPRTGILILHGDADERAPVASARLFASQLAALKRPHALVVYPGESHFLKEHREDVHARTLAWFRKFHQRVAVAPARAAPP